MVSYVCGKTITPQGNRILWLKDFELILLVERCSKTLGRGLQRPSARS
jgi:hypothetical protein